MKTVVREEIANEDKLSEGSRFVREPSLIDITYFLEA